MTIITFHEEEEETGPKMDPNRTRYDYRDDRLFLI